MISFLARRLVTLFATLVVAAIVIFAVTEVLPGDPAAVMLGLTATPETVAALRAELGLNARLSCDFSAGSAGFSPVISAFPTLIASRLRVSLPSACR